MTHVFLTVFNMSFTAVWVVLAVVLLRWCLKNAPKWIRCVLWAAVAIRLLIPFSVESPFSLLPSAQPVPPTIAQSEAPAIHSGVPFVDGAVNPLLNQLPKPETTPTTTPVTVPTAPSVPETKPTAAPTPTPSPQPSASPLETGLFVAAVVWLVGMAGMLLYTAVSYGRLKYRMRTSVLLRDNVRQSEAVPSPFVFGVFRPRVYIPFGMDADQQEYVIAHEQAHLKRRDHWIKPFAFVLLAVHWFNPFLWVAYVLLCRDIELACDEKVVKDMDAEERRAYSLALVKHSVSRRSVAACPLAFGETGVKGRIKAVMQYKKPAFWIVVAAVVACVAVAACFLTNPITPKTEGDETPVDPPVSASTAITVTPLFRELIEADPSAFTVTMQTFTLATQGGTVLYDCPQFGDGRLFDVNELILDAVFDRLSFFADFSAETNLDLECEVKYQNARFLSLWFTGLCNTKTAAHPTHVAFSVNVDVEKKRLVTLADMVTLDDAFVKRFEQAPKYNSGIDVSEAVETLYSSADVKRKLSVCDNAETADAFSYYTADRIYVSISTVFAAGDYAVAALPITETDSSVATWAITTADFDGDGTTERVRVQYVTDPAYYEVQVVDTDDRVLWEETVSFIHADQLAVYVYRHEGRAYLLLYRPFANMGNAIYSYQLLALSADSPSPQIVADRTLTFSYINATPLNTTELLAFAQELNGLLEDSTLVISTYTSGDDAIIGPKDGSLFAETFEGLDLSCSACEREMITAPVNDAHHSFTVSVGRCEHAVWSLTVTETETGKHVLSVALPGIEIVTRDLFYYKDVSGDGVADLLIPVERAAGYIRFAAYLWDEASYAFVYTPSFENICNPALDLENGKVYSRVQDASFSAYTVFRYDAAAKTYLFDGSLSFAYYERSEDPNDLGTTKVVESNRLHEEIVSVIVPASVEFYADPQHEAVKGYFESGSYWDITSNKWDCSFMEAAWF